jgi:hypothetical protein
MADKRLVPYSDSEEEEEELQKKMLSIRYKRRKMAVQLTRAKRIQSSK